MRTDFGGQSRYIIHPVHLSLCLTRRLHLHQSHFIELIQYLNCLNLSYLLTDAFRRLNYLVLNLLHIGLSSIQYYSHVMLKIRDQQFLEHYHFYLYFELLYSSQVLRLRQLEAFLQPFRFRILLRNHPIPPRHTPP